MLAPMNSSSTPQSIESLITSGVATLRSAAELHMSKNTEGYRTAIQKGCQVVHHLTEHPDVSGSAEHLHHFKEIRAILETLSSRPEADVLRVITLALENVLSALTEIKESTLSESKGTRTQLLKRFVQEFRYTSYLEIGCNDDSNFNQIQLPTKVGVDPTRGGTVRTTSDSFFATNHQRFDLIFIDGLHHADQVDRDVANAVRCLRQNGTIVLHDCNPRFEVRQVIPFFAGVWNGDVWKAAVRLRANPDLDVRVGDFDHGCAVVRIRPNSDQLTNLPSDLAYADLDRNRERWLRLTPFNELVEWAVTQKR